MHKTREEFHCLPAAAPHRGGGRVAGAAYPPPAASLPDFSPRETQVIGALYRGRATKQIAADLKLSINTVKHYLKRAYHKAQVHSARELLFQVYGAADGTHPYAGPTLRCVETLLAAADAAAARRELVAGAREISGGEARLLENALAEDCALAEPSTPGSGPWAGVLDSRFIAAVRHRGFEQAIGGAVVLGVRLTLNLRRRRGCGPSRLDDQRALHSVVAEATEVRTLEAVLARLIGGDMDDHRLPLRQIFFDVERLDLKAVLVIHRRDPHVHLFALAHADDFRFEAEFARRHLDGAGRGSVRCLRCGSVLSKPCDCAQPNHQHSGDAQQLRLLHEPPSFQYKSGHAASLH